MVSGLVGNPMNGSFGTRIFSMYSFAKGRHSFCRAPDQAVVVRIPAVREEAMIDGKEKYASAKKTTFAAPPSFKLLPISMEITNEVLSHPNCSAGTFNYTA
jgi:hypothetical protein